MSSWSPRRLSAFLLVYAVQVSACGPLDAEEGRLEAKGREDKGRFAELAAGTSLEVQLGAEISTRSTSVGSPISGFTIRPVVYGGVSLIPAGSEVKGVVTLISKDPPVLSAAFSPDNTLLVTASADGSAIVWDVETGESESATTSCIALPTQYGKPPLLGNSDVVTSPLHQVLTEFLRRGGLGVRSKS